MAHKVVRLSPRGRRFSLLVVPCLCQEQVVSNTMFRRDILLNAEGAVVNRAHIVIVRDPTKVTRYNV